MKEVFTLIDDDHEILGIFESRELALKKLEEQYGKHYNIQNFRDVRDSGIDSDFYLVNKKVKERWIFITILNHKLNDLDNYL